MVDFLPSKQTAWVRIPLSPLQNRFILKYATRNEIITLSKSLYWGFFIFNIFISMNKKICNKCKSEKDEKEFYLIKKTENRKGNCLDNAVIENFFGILKSEMFYTQKFKSIEQLKKEIDKYINLL